MSAAVEAARESVREAMIARTAYWYNAVACTDDLRPQIESELAVADDEYESALDAFEAACRAEGAAEMLREKPCAGEGWCANMSRSVERLCLSCAARAEKASAG